MLLANISVAEKILKEFPECAMLRRHPEPPQANFTPLIKAGQNRVSHSLKQVINLLCKNEYKSFGCFKISGL